MKMKQENTDIHMFAPCGMNCIVCYKHCCPNNRVLVLLEQRP